MVTKRKLPKPSLTQQVRILRLENKELRSYIATANEELNTALLEIKRITELEQRGVASLKAPGLYCVHGNQKTTNHRIRAEAKRAHDGPHVR